MERVLHRVNTLERLRLAREAGLDRVEIDLRYRRGGFVLSHDIPAGPWSLGRSGAEGSPAPYLLVHWEGRFLRLPELLHREAPPLFVDMKGRWPKGALGELSSFLDQFERDRDVLASNHWERLDRCRGIDPARRCVYALSRRTISAFRARLRQGDRPFGVSLDFKLLGDLDEFMNELRAAEVAIYVWHLRRREALLELEQAGVYGAIFDDPGWAT